MNVVKMFFLTLSCVTRDADLAMGTDKMFPI